MLDPQKKKKKKNPLAYLGTPNGDLSINSSITIT